MRLLPQLNLPSALRSINSVKKSSGHESKDVWESPSKNFANNQGSVQQPPANRSPGTAPGYSNGGRPGTRSSVRSSEATSISSRGSSRTGSAVNPAKATNVEEDLVFGKIYGIIPNKLSYVVQRSEKLSSEQLKSVQTPGGPEYLLLSCELPKQYYAFCHDFGPTNLGVVYRFCEFMRGKLKWANKMNNVRPGVHLVFRFSQDAKIRTNAGFLMSAYLMLEEGYSLERALEPFLHLRTYQFLDYRDVTTGESTFDISVTDCLRGLQKAVQLGWFDLKKFDINDYEHWDDPKNGDVHQVCPKFIAFKGPQTDSLGNTLKPKEGEEFTHYVHEPSHYFSAFRKKGVSAVVRLNEWKTYRADNFRAAGFRHHELYFDDCTSPPDSLVRTFLRMVDQESGVVAVHCKAGLGRTGCLIAVYIMERFGFTAREAIAWLRISRPGMVIGPQQNYLQAYEDTVMAGINQGAAGNSDGFPRSSSDPTNSRKQPFARAGSSVVSRSYDATTAQSAQEMADQVWAGTVIRNKRRDRQSGPSVFAR